ncbi:MAG: hypothetical protein WB424_09000 [Terracidiphilus sp.]
MKVKRTNPRSARIRTDGRARPQETFIPGGGWINRRAWMKAGLLDRMAFGCGTSTIPHPKAF